jgi:hypothetical protein
VPQVVYGAVRYDMTLLWPRLTRKAYEAALAEVSAHWRLSPWEMTGPSRVRRLARARQHLMWLLRSRGYSYPQIGKAMCLDHSTVIYGVRQHAKRSHEVFHKEQKECGRGVACSPRPVVQSCEPAEAA